MQTECLVVGDSASLIDVKVRFLHLVTLSGWAGGPSSEFVRVPPCRCDALLAESFKARLPVLMVGKEATMTVEPGRDT